MHRRPVRNRSTLIMLGFFILGCPFLKIWIVALVVIIMKGEGKCNCEWKRGRGTRRKIKYFPALTVGWDWYPIRSLSVFLTLLVLLFVVFCCVVVSWRCHYIASFYRLSGWQNLRYWKYDYWLDGVLERVWKIIPAIYMDLWELLSITPFGGLVRSWCILLLKVEVGSYL